MSFRIREHDAALHELQEAARWYEEQQPGLGSDFLDAVDHVIGRIREWPHIGRVIGESRRTSIRSRAVAVFPYQVLYLVLDDTIYVLAYAHNRRLPGYWRERTAPARGDQ